MIAFVAIHALGWAAMLVLLLFTSAEAGKEDWNRSRMALIVFFAAGTVWGGWSLVQAISAAC